MASTCSVPEQTTWLSGRGTSPCAFAIATDLELRGMDIACANHAIVLSRWALPEKWPSSSWSECSVASTRGGWKCALASQTRARRETDWNCWRKRLQTWPPCWLQTVSNQYAQTITLWTCIGLRPAKPFSRHRFLEKILALSGASWPVMTTHLAICLRGSSSSFHTLGSKKAWLCPSMVQMQKVKGVTHTAWGLAYEAAVYIETTLCEGQRGLARQKHIFVCPKLWD